MRRRTCITNAAGICNIFDFVVVVIDGAGAGAGADTLGIRY